MKKILVQVGFALAIIGATIASTTAPDSGELQFSATKQYCC